MPDPLSVAAAAIDDTQVPWPLGSTVGSVPNADHPGASRDDKSATDPSTPVSTTAMVDDPAGATESRAVSHATLGNAHWSAYAGSLGAAATLRVWSTSTLVTDESCL